MNGTVAVIGLGKLGAPLAACVASKGFEVIGVDVDPAVIDTVNRGEAPVYEPGLQELMAAHRERLSATADHREALARADITFITVPTPSREDGGFSLEYVLRAAESIGGALRDKDGYHLVVLTSTVMPGATAGEVMPRLEEASGKRCGEGFGLCYSPEFIALGSVIRDFLNPDFVLIGESDPAAGERLEGFYLEVCGNRPRAARMSFANAELAKLAVNTFVTTKITFANMLARICERLPGADVDEVTQALGMDSRIGGKYLKGAIGYGGPCFPRDNIALSHLAASLGLPASLAGATDLANREGLEYLVELVEGRLRPGERAGILGLAYKPGTDVSEESQGMLLARTLAERGIPVVVYDPAAMGGSRAFLDSRVDFAPSAEDCLRGCGVLVIATPWEEFGDLFAPGEGTPGRPRVVIDCWRMLPPERRGSIEEYVPLGVAGG